MEQLTIWEINDLHLELDITDADTVERYEHAMNGLVKDIPAVGTVGLSTSAYIRAFCKAHRNMYDALFGKGTGAKIFDGIPDSIIKYNAIYGKFLAFASRQSNSASTEIKQLHEKYLPKGAKKGKRK